MINQQQPDITKFEFLLTLEGNIICQRFFKYCGGFENKKFRLSM